MTGPGTWVWVAARRASPASWKSSRMKMGLIIDMG